MLVCGRCGEAAAQGAPFCPRCGSNLGDPGPDSPYPSYPPYPSHPQYPPNAPYGPAPYGPAPYGPAPSGPAPYGPAPSGPPGIRPRPATGSASRVAIVLSIGAALVVVIGFVIAVGLSSSRPAPDRQVAVPTRRGAIPLDPAPPAGPTLAPIVPGATVPGGSAGSVVPAAALPFANPGGAFIPMSPVMPLDARGAYELQAGGSPSSSFAGYLGGHHRTWSDTPTTLLRITILQFSDAGAAAGAQATIAAFWQADHRTVQTFDALPGAMEAMATAASRDANQGIHTVSFTKGPVLVVVRLSREGEPTDDIAGVALAQYDALG